MSSTALRSSNGAKSARQARTLEQYQYLDKSSVRAFTESVRDWAIISHHPIYTPDSYRSSLTSVSLFLHPHYAAPSLTVNLPRNTAHACEQKSAVRRTDTQLDGRAAVRRPPLVVRVFQLRETEKERETQWYVVTMDRSCENAASWYSYIENEDDSQSFRVWTNQHDKCLHANAPMRTIHPSAWEQVECA